MKDLCLEAKIKEDKYDRILDQPEKLPLFEDFRKGPYADALEIKNLLTPETWTMYKAFGFRGLREIKLLRTAFKEMREFFDAKFVAVQKETSRDSSKLQDGQDIQSIDGKIDG